MPYYKRCGGGGDSGSGGGSCAICLMNDVRRARRSRLPPSLDLFSISLSLYLPFHFPTDSTEEKLFIGRISVVYYRACLGYRRGVE